MPPNGNHPPPTPKSTLRPKSFQTNPALFTFTWAITILLSPILTAILLTLYIYRGITRLLARNISNLSSPLIPHDCIFAVDSYHTRPYASNLTVLELGSRLDLQTLRATFKTRILDDPTFSKLLYTPVEYLGYWFWKKLDNKLDINECIKLHHDSELELGPTKSIDDCLREIVEMPYKTELFNVLLLHFGNKSMIVIRIHHTVCDGYSFNRLVDKFVGLQSKYLVKDKKEERGVLRTVKDELKEWKQMAYLVLHLPLHVCTLYRESLTHTPNFYTLRKVSTTGTIRRTVLPLSQMKHLRATANSHFASIGMSLMTGALQKYYDSTPHPPHLRPDRLSIMHSLPKPNHPINSSKPSMTNCWNVGLFKIPFTRDSVQRMYGSEDDFKEYMGLQFDSVLDVHIPIVSLVPCWVIKWFFSINFGTSCGFTSVPGLFDKVAYVGGGVDIVDGGAVEGKPAVEVSHMWKVFGLQWRESAVAVAMYTYRGEASVSLYANKDIIPDDRSMDRLLELFHEEFNELVAYSNTAKPHQIIQATNPPKPQQKSSPVSNIFDSQKSHNIIDTKFLDACFRNNKLA